MLRSRELEGLLPWDPERSARPTQCRQCQGPQRRLALTPDRLLDFKQMAALVSECLLIVLMVRGYKGAVKANGETVHVICPDLPQLPVSDPTVPGSR